MSKSVFRFTLCAILFALCLPVQAQQAGKIPQIGFLEGASVATSQGIDPFLQGLRERGYVNGQNIIVEVRSIEGKPDRIPDIVTEFINRKVDVIFTPVTEGALAAKKATATIPVVVVAGDPVGSGLVTSLARPGGNVTGLSAFVELGGKRLEILKDTVPSLNRAALFWNPARTLHEFQHKDIEVAAGVLGVKLQSIQVFGPEDFENGFKSAIRGRAGALLVLRSPMLVAHRKQFLKLAGDTRLPAIYDDRNFVEPGGLMSYGPDRVDLFRRAAIYVDKILKGAKPADLPVEQPMKFEFVINLKTAKQIGLTIPPNVLVRADRVIR
jgi:putative ABC transport system substrate-binding protein